MALAGRIRNLINGAATCNPAVLQTLRFMSTSKIFVGGLSYSTDEHSLKEAFTGFGEVVEARLVTDRETGRSRGFGFVTFGSGEEASAAITGMDGKDLQGRVIRVNYATDRAGGGFRSGYGDGGSFDRSGYGDSGSYTRDNYRGGRDN